MSKLIPESQLTKEQQSRFLSAASVGSVFLQSAYRHNLLPPDHWLIYMDEAETYFVPLAHKKWLGVAMIFTPVFFRYTQVVGNLNNFDFKVFSKTLTKQFKLIQINWKGEVERQDQFEISPKKHQVLNAQPRSYSKLAKRMLNKARKSGLAVKNTKELTDILAIIQIELCEKNSILSKNDMHTLKRLTTNNIETKNLSSIALFSDNKVVGGLIYFNYNDTVLYLKGTCISNFKNQGGMYLLMDHLVQSVNYSKNYLDFGGSNVEGVQQFNYKFGASDEIYHALFYDKAPWWHKLIRKWIARNK
ncbi:MAG: hypothetical protein JJT77_11270 [Crocinitomicaceae bacterium]|nr:hypothetical protein [Crocinitomicaceae bacterium]